MWFQNIKYEVSFLILIKNGKQVYKRKLKDNEFEPRIDGYTEIDVKIFLEKNCKTKHAKSFDSFIFKCENSYDANKYEHL